MKVTTGAMRPVDLISRGTKDAFMATNCARTTRQALKHNGGKWLLADWIISHFPKHRTYVDLFGGGANVLLKKPRVGEEHYVELSGEITNFFRVIRDEGQQFIRKLKRTPYSEAEFLDCLTVPEDADDVERARRFYVRTMQGRFVNLRPSWRELGNVRQVGGHNPGRLFADLRGIVEARRRFSGVMIHRANAFKVAPKLDAPDTMFYVDPPYPQWTRGDGDLYVHELKTALQHARLLRMLRKLKGYVVLSSYPNALYDRMLPGWTCVTKTTRDQSRSERVEALYLCPRTSAAQGQPDLFGA